MADVLIREIWKNDTGALAYDEENSGQRYSWIPGPQSWPTGGAAGQPGRMYIDTLVGTPANPTADAFTGGPVSRREHYFEIPTRGYDRLFIEWSGECVSSEGVTIDAGIPGVPNTFLEYYDSLFVNAHGQGYTNPRLPMTRYPQAISRALAEDPHNNSTFGNSAAGGGSDDVHVAVANTKRLYVKGPGINFRNLGSNRNRLMAGMNPAVVPASMYVGGYPLAQGTLWYGFTQYDAGGNPRPTPVVNGTGSRLPAAGDRYGFIIEVGWPDSCPIDGPFLPATGMFDLGPLRVEHLERVMVHMLALMPSGAGAGASLDFSGPVEHRVKGRMCAILTRRSTGPKPEFIYIDREGRVTEEDPHEFQTVGHGRR